MPLGPLKILVAEDETPLRNLIRLSLEAAGHTVLAVSDGQVALERFEQEQVDLIILDIMMPRVDGFTVCRTVRRRSDVPVLMLTALGDIDDVVTGFEAGADDYITKPFSFKEVDARIKAIMRRVEAARRPGPSHVITIGRVTVDPEARSAHVGNQPIHLTPIEFSLLYYLMSHPGQAIGKEQLFRDVWGYDFVAGTNLVEVGVRRLREKIEADPSNPEYILTVRGAGYKFRENDATPDKKPTA
jgi:OmpR family response regulator RpaB